MELFKKNSNGAKFSSDRKYRYALWRIWSSEKPFVLFIGLNPSTANETQNDPTIRRVVNFAFDWGYGGVVMCNLFGIVSTDPKILESHPDPIGNNDLTLPYFGNLASEVVFAWGNFEQANNRAKTIARMFPDGRALMLNKNGTPRHPLYVKADVKRVMYKTGLPIV